ncbi:hypothetical protein LAV82_23250 [Bacillus sp. ILBB4]|nr:hypothetical protein [Bacillus sp. ILBB4]
MKKNNQKRVVKVVSEKMVVRDGKETIVLTVLSKKPSIRVRFFKWFWKKVGITSYEQLESNVKSFMNIALLSVGVIGSLLGIYIVYCLMWLMK